MKAKILAVDDEPSIRKLVTVTLENKGYEVITAENGEDALVKAAVNEPDLIVLDIMMPKMDGHEVHRRLRADEKTKAIPVIFLSAAGRFEEQLESLEEGLVDFITKPFKPSELADRIETILDPAKRAEFERERSKREAKLRKIVEIMHRERD